MKLFLGFNWHGLRIIIDGKILFKACESNKSNKVRYSL